MVVWASLRGCVSVARPQRGAGGRCRRSLEVRVSDGPPEEGPGLALGRSKRTQKTPEREIERQRARQKGLRNQLKALPRSPLRGFPGRPRGRAPRDPKCDSDCKVCKLTVACGDIRPRGQQSPGARASTPVQLTHSLRLADATTSASGRRHPMRASVKTWRARSGSSSCLGPRPLGGSCISLDLPELRCRCSYRPSSDRAASQGAQMLLDAQYRESQTSRRLRKERSHGGQPSRRGSGSR